MRSEYLDDVYRLAIMKETIVGANPAKYSEQCTLRKQLLAVFSRVSNIDIGEILPVNHYSKLRRLRR